MYATFICVYIYVEMNMHICTSMYIYGSVRIHVERVTARAIVREGAYKHIGVRFGYVRVCSDICT